MFYIPAYRKEFKGGVGLARKDGTYRWRIKKNNTDSNNKYLLELNYIIF